MNGSIACARNVTTQACRRALSSDEVPWGVDRSLPKWWLEYASVERYRKHCRGDAMGHERQFLRAGARISQIRSHGGLSGALRTVAKPGDSVMLEDTPV
eukprot:2449002-Pyramimonas_sp.AAC.1